MAHPTRVLLITLLHLTTSLPPVALLPATLPAPLAAPADTQEEPVPVPFIEREEVRFVTLDLVAEEQTGGWRPLRDLTLGEIEVRVGDRVMPLDQFDNHCLPAPAPQSPPADAPPNRPPPGAETGPVPPGAEAGGRYILYFDLEHLELAGREAAFKAANKWAGREFHPADEVMIITAGRGLRIVRSFLPPADHLREDLEAARGDFRATELWGALESMRLSRLGEEKIPTVRRSTADSYVQIDRSKTKNSLSNLRDIMTIFDAVEGTKNLILFADTIRLVPGGQYGGTTTRLVDVHTELQGLARAANERNVRFYPVKAGLAAYGRADSALTMLASETGGKVIEGSNEVDGAFARVDEDLACFYRVGFRFRPRYSGRVEPVRVRLHDREGTVRLRYRQTLADPTHEALDADMVRAAFMAPSSSNDFPIVVRATELFRQTGGARLQIEISSPLGAMLDLPVPGEQRGSRQVHLQVGARVLPLRRIDGAGPSSSRGGIWADVATDRRSIGFGRKAMLTLPPLPDPDHADQRVVATDEFDAPPGRYRVVAVIQDQLARTIAAAMTDLEVEADSPRLGPIGLASGDTHAVLVRNEPADAVAGNASSRESSDWHGKELATAWPLLPPGTLLNETSIVEAGGAVHLFYSVCVEPPGKGQRSRRTGPSSSSGWEIERILTCGPERAAVRLPPRSLPAEQRGVRCVPLLDSIPADTLGPGRCRFDVLLSSPGGDREGAVREFSVVPPARPDSTTIGSLTLRANRPPLSARDRL